MTHNIKGNYEGYIWMSDATHPVVYTPARPIDITLDDNDNPFVIEGELYDASKGESVTIRYADGKYYKKTFNVAPSDLKGSEKVTKKEYLAQRMPGINSLKYLQYWDEVDEVDDEFCEHMKTLQPGDLVFVGFKSKEE